MTISVIDSWGHEHTIRIDRYRLNGEERIWIQVSDSGQPESASILLIGPDIDRLIAAVTAEPVNQGGA